MAAKKQQGDAPVTIKKYANRRLYNTSTSSYVTLDHLCQMVKDGVDFAVFDAKSGEDITRAVLTQIIVEEEGKGDNLLPISFLRQIISFYGDSMQRMLLPRYLEHSMDVFSENRERMQSYMKEAMGGMFPFGSLEDLGKQNMAIFEQTMKMFSPLGDANQADSGDARKTGDKDDENDRVRDLQNKLNELQQQLNDMAKK
ncbi:MAG: polyhydroxyalkanoate synthesis repressor PhaR [Pseudomonadota bacterium]